MSSHEDVEHVEFTRMEKILALALVVFLLIGGWWVLGALGRLVPRPDWSAIESRHDVDRLQNEMSALEQQLWSARQMVSERKIELDRARLEYEFRREEYRTYLGTGVDDPDLLAAYELARDRMESARQLVQAGESVLEAREEAAAAARHAYHRVREQVSQEHWRAQALYELRLFLLRLAYALPLLLLSLVAWQRFRTRKTGHLIILTSIAAFAALQLLILMGQYAWTVFREAAQLAISIGGSAIAIGGLIALRRMLGNPERRALAHLRNGQCPGCGFPLGDGEYCHSCGRCVLSECQSCGLSGLIHASYCSHCGSPRE